MTEPHEHIPSGAEERAPHTPQSADAEAGSMDAANQSLADALRITFFIVRLGLVALLGAFLASGFQAIREGENGIVLQFGRVASTDVRPGYVWSWPFPIGEVQRVGTAPVLVRLHRAFYPDLSEREMRSDPQQIAATRKRSLAPGQDGSNLLAGLDIAHTQWDVTYVRRSPTQFAKNIHALDEEEIVSAAVERAVVRVMAGTTIERLIQQSQSGSGGTTLETRVRAIAQETLDSMESGIWIERVGMRRGHGPHSVYPAILSVGNASVEAARTGDEAKNGARQMLNAAAGDAHELLLALIDEYERSIEMNGVEDAKPASPIAQGGGAVEAADCQLAAPTGLASAQRSPDAILADIDCLLTGRAKMHEDRAHLVTGEAAGFISAARRYRTDVELNAQQRAQTFEVKLGQYRDNAAVFVASEWSRAYAAYYENNAVEQFIVPSRSQALELILNSDPELARRAEEARNRGQVETAGERQLERLDGRGGGGGGG